MATLFEVLRTREHYIYNSFWGSLLFEAIFFQNNRYLYKGLSSMQINALKILLGSIYCSTDEAATEAILKCEQSYANLCGKLGMTTPRDAFITALCKASLPPHYTLTVLQSSSQQPQGAGLQRSKLSFTTYRNILS